MPSETMQAVVASGRVHALLDRLHAQSEAQEKSLSQRFFYATRLLRHYLFGEGWSAAMDDHMREKFVALEPDKCRLVYLLARSMGARFIVEAGTSFGVSTVYLALAVGQNVADATRAGSLPKDRGAAAAGKVIATENEPTKAARAREHWREAGDEVEPWIELREGDLRETLRADEGMPEEVDMLLLDIWTPMALPTLEIIRPRLRRGSIVVADNTSSAKRLYAELLDYIHRPENGFKAMTLPFGGGLELSVYLPED